MNFKEKCYQILKKVPKGKVTTYKAIANSLNSKAYRAVGTAMKKNISKKVPCHRVINSDGKIGQYNLGVSKKIQLLKSEGIMVENNKVDLNKYEFKFGTTNNLKYNGFNI